MYDIIIIGAGVAGMTASLYCARAGKKVLVLEGGTIGGQIASSPKVENYPGIKSISGLELADNLFEQASSLGVEFDFETVQQIGVEDGKRYVLCANAKLYCKAIIVATGAKRRMLGVEREQELVGHGVGYCVVCDGDFYSGKNVAVVGGGNSALQSAIYLSKICKSVDILQLLPNLTGEKQLCDDVYATKNINVLTNTSVAKLLGDKELSAVEIVRDEKKEVLSIDALFISIGLIPESKPFKETLSIGANGYIQAGEDCKTNIEGVFVAGDVRTKAFRQITTATSDGTISAISACSFVDNN